MRTSATAAGRSTDPLRTTPTRRFGGVTNRLRNSSCTRRLHLKLAGAFVGPCILAVSLLQIRTRADGTPRATLIPVPTRAVTIPADVDSSVPMVWDLVDGSWTLFALASWGGQPVLTHGTQLDRLVKDGPITMSGHPGNGVWMEAIVPDEAGAWYGFYHHEVPADICERHDRTILNMGLARSRDHGMTWENLGFILDGPPNSQACASMNYYQLGGVGDPSVMLDADHQFVYLFFSQYGKDPAAQGVAIARLAWADRDAPIGKVDVLQDGMWLPPRRVDDGSGPQLEYPHGTPLVPVANPFHDGDFDVDAFWGASVHWNTYLQCYVMLLNRAKNEKFDNEGIYVSYSTELGNPRAWSVPVKLLTEADWYPHVAGLERGGTDREAGQRARFFLRGLSQWYIQFSR
jgi:hypothetical protein